MGGYMTDTISLFLRRKQGGEIVAELTVAAQHYAAYREHLSRKMGTHYFVDTDPPLYFLEKWDNR